MAWTPPGRGLLRDRVKFTRREATGQNVGGHVRRNWEVLPNSERRVRLEAVRGGEQVQGDRLQGVVGFNLDVPQDQVTRSLTTDDRVIDSRNPARTFSISAILDLEGRGRWFTLSLQQGANPDG